MSPRPGSGDLVCPMFPGVVVLSGLVLLAVASCCAPSTIQLTRSSITINGGKGSLSCRTRRLPRRKGCSKAGPFFAARCPEPQRQELPLGPCSGLIMAEWIAIIKGGLASAQPGPSPPDSHGGGPPPDGLSPSCSAASHRRASGRATLHLARLHQGMGQPGATSDKLFQFTRSSRHSALPLCCAAPPDPP